MPRVGCPIDHCQKPEEAASQAVKKVFEILGVNVDDPVQVENFRKGLRFGEDLLKMTNKGKMAAMISFIGLSAAAVWKSFLIKGDAHRAELFRCNIPRPGSLA